MPLIVGGSALPTDKPIHSNGGEIHRVITKNGDVIWEMVTGLQPSDFAFIKEQGHGGVPQYGGYIDHGGTTDAWSFGDTTTRTIPGSPNVKLHEVFDKGTGIQDLEYMVGTNHSIGWYLKPGKWVAATETITEKHGVIQINHAYVAKLVGTPGNESNPATAPNPQTIVVGDIYSFSSKHVDGRVFKVKDTAGHLYKWKQD